MDVVNYWGYDFDGDIDNLVVNSRRIQSYEMREFKNLKGGGWDEIQHTAMCKKYIAYTKNDDGTLTIDNHCIDFASIYVKLRNQYAAEADIHVDKQYGRKYYIDPTNHGAGGIIGRDWFLECVKACKEEARKRIDESLTIDKSIIAQIDLKIGYEEKISVAVAEAIAKNIPDNVRYICFSDTHGDIAAYLVGALLSMKFPTAYVFSLGDAINQKWDFWDNCYTNQWKQDAEYMIRDWYIGKIEKQLLSDSGRNALHFICVHGNHDAEFQGHRPSRAVVINPKYQLLFQHAIISPPFEEKMSVEPCDTIYNDDDIIYLYLSDAGTNDIDEKYDELTGDGFLRATRGGKYLEQALKVDLKTIDDGIHKIITTAAADTPITYNPYCTFGHDYTYFYIAALVKEMKIDTIPGDEEKIDALADILLENGDELADFRFMTYRTSNIGIFARIFDCDGCIYCLFKRKMKGGNNTGSKTISIFIIAIAAIIVITIICYVIMYVITLKTVKDVGENHFLL